MGLFNKKKEDDKPKKSQVSKAEFKILIWTKVAGSRRLVRQFDAVRFVDEDKVPFIYNEELKFMELYPQDIKKSTKKYDAKEIEKEIKELETKLEKIRNKPIEEYKEEEPNTNDLEKKILILKARLRYDYYSEDNNAYEYYDDNGRVCIDFLRKGNTFFPLKCDLDTNTIHTASEPVVKKAGILLRNKENKYLPKKLIETATLILLIAVIVWTLANLGFAGWLWKKYDQSALAEDVRFQLELTNKCSEIILNTAKTVEDIATKTLDSLNEKTTNVIQGVNPG